MARGGTGTYTLPAGNPVVTGTTITPTWANTTLADLAAEVTDSLSRSGKGGMSAALKLADGTAALPGMTFSNDTDSGIYRGGANDVRMSAGGGLIAQWTTSTYTVWGAISTTVYFRAATGAVGAPAYSFTDDPDSGLYRAGAGDIRMSIDANDVMGVNASGVNVTGALGVSSTIDSKKITATGAAGVAGGEFANGTSATAAARHTACKLANGDLDLDGVANPNPDVGLKNKLTPASLVKAWARVQTNGAGGVTLLGGMNIAAVAIGGTQAYVELTLGEPLLDQNHAALFAMTYGASNPFRQYGCLMAPVGPPFYGVRVEGVAITYTPPPTVVTPINFATSINNFYVVVFGRQ